MRRELASGLGLIGVGTVLAAPMAVAIILAGPTRLVVLAPSLAWLFVAVPAGAIAGVLMAIAGAWLIVRRTRA
jgi:nitrate reductase gamma subunit